MEIPEFKGLRGLSYKKAYRMLRLRGWNESDAYTCLKLGPGRGLIRKRRRKR